MSGEQHTSRSLELCAWDLDGTIRPGTLLADAIQHGVTQGFIDPNDYADITRPTYAETNYFVNAIRHQSRRVFTELTDKLTDEAPSQAFPWAIEELAAQTDHQHAVIFSHSPDFLVRAFARGLETVRHGRGSYFHTRQLIFSGRATTLEKLTAIRRYNLQHGTTLAFAAGDTMSDAPMLLRASKRAVAVNPTGKFASLALEHDWEVIDTAHG